MRAISPEPPLQFDDQYVDNDKAALLSTGSDMGQSSTIDPEKHTTHRAGEIHCKRALQIITSFLFLFISLRLTNVVDLEVRRRTLSAGQDGGVILFGTLVAYLKHNTSFTSILYFFYFTSSLALICLMFDIGDSLIGRSTNRFGMISYLSSTTSFDLGYLDKGVSSDTALRMRNRLQDVLEQVSSAHVSGVPVLVLLLWDTDICGDKSDINATADARIVIRATYRNNVRYIVQTLLGAGVAVALGGPVLCNVGYTEEGLDAYREINRAVCSELSVPYMDIRSEYVFFQEKGVSVTADGEHPNQRGARIIGDFFVEEIVKWQHQLELTSASTSALR